MEEDVGALDVEVVGEAERAVDAVVAEAVGIVPVVVLAYAGRVKLQSNSCAYSSSLTHAGAVATGKSSSRSLLP